MGHDARDSAASGPPLPGTTGDLPELGVPEKSVVLGQLLEEFRPYLLAIANAEFPKTLAAKLGPSDVVQLTLAKGHVQFEDFRGQSRDELAQWLRTILLNHLNST